MRSPPLDADAAPRARFMARLDAVGTSSLASVRTIAGRVRTVASDVLIRRSRFTCPQFNYFLILRKFFGFGNNAPGAGHL